MQSKNLAQPILDPQGEDVPKFELKIYSFDSYSLEDAKELEKKYEIKLRDSKDVPINFEINNAFAFIDDPRLVQCQVRIKLSYKQKELDLRLAEFRIAFDYFVEAYNSYRHEGNRYTFSINFLMKLGNTSISTARGLLSGKFCNTYLQNAVLPVVVPKPTIQMAEKSVKIGNPKS